MGVLAWITAVVAAIGFGMAGFAKLSWQQQMKEASEHLGFSKQSFQAIGGAEVLGAAGALLGTAVGSLEWIAIAAQLGLTIVGGGAMLQHRKAGDEPAAFMPALALGAVALVGVIALTMR